MVLPFVLRPRFPSTLFAPANNSAILIFSTLITATCVPVKSKQNRFITWWNLAFRKWVRTATSVAWRRRTDRCNIDHDNRKGYYYTTVVLIRIHSLDGSFCVSDAAISADRVDSTEITQAQHFSVYTGLDWHLITWEKPFKSAAPLESNPIMNQRDFMDAKVTFDEPVLKMVHKNLKNETSWSRITVMLFSTSATNQAWI